MPEGRGGCQRGDARGDGGVPEGRGDARGDVPWDLPFGSEHSTHGLPSSDQTLSQGSRLPPGYTQADQLAQWDSHVANLAARHPDTGSRTAASRALSAAQLAGERHGVGASAGTTPGAAAADRAGEVGRLAGRYQRSPDPKVWDLSHTIRGANQVWAGEGGGGQRAVHIELRGDLPRHSVVTS